MNLEGGEEGYQSVGIEGNSKDGYRRIVPTMGPCTLSEPRSDSGHPAG